MTNTNTNIVERIALVRHSGQLAVHAGDQVNDAALRSLFTVGLLAAILHHKKGGVSPVGFAGLASSHELPISSKVEQLRVSNVEGNIGNVVQGERDVIALRQPKKTKAKKNAAKADKAAAMTASAATTKAAAMM